MSLEKVYEIKKQWLPLYFIFLIISIIVTLYLLLMYLYTGDESFMMYIMLSALFSFYIGFNLVRLLKFKTPKYNYVKVLKCSKCEYSTVKPMTKGDYLFKKDGECPKCNGLMYISALYREKIKG